MASASEASVVMNDRKKDDDPYDLLGCLMEAWDNIPTHMVPPRIGRVGRNLFISLFKHTMERGCVNPGDGLESATFPRVIDAKTLPQAWPGRSMNRGMLLDKLFVIKIVNKLQGIDQDVAPLITNIKLLNDRYRCDIPVILVGHHGNREGLKRAIENISQQNITIHPYFQGLFPYVQMTLQEGKRQYSLTQGHSVSSEDAWYPPGDGYVLAKCAGFMGARQCTPLDILFRKSMEKEIMLLINSEFCSVDLQILSLMNARQHIDMCFEIVDASNFPPPLKELVDTYAVCHDKKLKVIDEANLPHHLNSENKYQYSVTNNVWIRTAALFGVAESSFIDILLNKQKIISGVESIELEAKAVSAAEFFGETAFPLRILADREIKENSASLHSRWLWKVLHPTRAERWRVKQLAKLASVYFVYHIVVMLISGFLENRYEGKEAVLAWIEGTVWYLILIVYAIVQYIRRSRRRRYLMRAVDRWREIRVDTWQLLLLGFTRFLYTGVTKSFGKTEKGFFSTHWGILILAHFIALIIEVVGSYLITLFVGIGFFEPLEFYASVTLRYNFSNGCNFWNTRIMYVPRC